MSPRSFERHLDTDVLYADHINELQVALEEDDTRIEGKAPLEHEHSMENVSGLVPAIDGKADEEHTHTSTEIVDFDDAVMVHTLSFPNGQGEMGNNTNFPNTTYVATSIATGDVGHFELASSQSTTTPWIEVGNPRKIIVYYTTQGAVGTITVDYRRVDGTSSSMGSSSFGEIGGNFARTVEPAAQVMTHIRLTFSNTSPTNVLKFGGINIVPYTSASDAGAYTKTEVDTQLATVNTKISDQDIFQATITNVEGNDISFRRLGEDVDQVGKRINGPAVFPSDIVSILPYEDTYLVLGKVDKGPVRISDPMEIRPTSSGPNTLVVKNSDGTTKFNVDVNSGNGSISNNFEVGGSLTNKGTEVFPVIPFSGSNSQTEVRTTLNTSTWVDGLRTTISLGAGTWHISGVMGISLQHSTSGSVNIGGEIGSAISTSWVGAPQGSWTPLMVSVSETIILSSTTNVNVAVLFKGVAAGTTYSHNAWYNLVARRVA